MSKTHNTVSTLTRPSIRFITVEGGEGAGKTTLIKELQKYLVNRGVEVVVTREPGGTALGEHVRGWVLNKNPALKIDAKAELLLFLAGRAQHIEELILPSIKAGKVVICDRFNDSSVAYQGAGRGLGVSWVRNLCNTVSGEAVPDLTFYLDVDPEVGLQRTRRAVKENAAAGDVDRIESEKKEFHNIVRDSFISISKTEPNRFHVIDANAPRHAVIDAALKFLITKLP